MDEFQKKKKITINKNKYSHLSQNCIMSQRFCRKLHVKINGSVGITDQVRHIKGTPGLKIKNTITDKHIPHLESRDK